MKKETGRHGFECMYCKRIFYTNRRRPRKYCCKDCYIQDRYWTDQSVPVDIEEIRIRQQIAEHIPTRMVLRRIS